MCECSLWRDYFPTGWVLANVTILMIQNACVGIREEQVSVLDFKNSSTLRLVEREEQEKVTKRSGARQRETKAWHPERTWQQIRLCGQNNKAFSTLWQISRGKFYKFNTLQLWKTNGGRRITHCLGFFPLETIRWVPSLGCANRNMAGWREHNIDTVPLQKRGHCVCVLIKGTSVSLIVER